MSLSHTRSQTDRINVFVEEQLSKKADKQQKRVCVQDAFTPLAHGAP